MIYRYIYIYIYIYLRTSRESLFSARWFPGRFSEVLQDLEVHNLTWLSCFLRCNIHKVFFVISLTQYHPNSLKNAAELFADWFAYGCNTRRLSWWFVSRGVL